MFATKIRGKPSFRLDAYHIFILDVREALQIINHHVISQAIGMQRTQFKKKGDTGFQTV